MIFVDIQTVNYASEIEVLETIACASYQSAVALEEFINNIAGYSAEIQEK